MRDQDTLSAWFDVVNIAALFVMSMTAAYFFLAVGLGVHQMRRHRTPIGFQADIGFGKPFRRLRDARPVAPGAWVVYFLIPCLNEEEVIGRTVSSLVAPRGWRTQIVVIDDGSDDATTQRALAAGGDQVRVVRRRLPEARKGKGAALNAGLAYVLGDIAARRIDPERVVIAVMDADGRLSDGAMHEVLPLFDRARVGGAMLAVRIRNRSTNLLLRLQDHQFWTLSALSQFGRISTDTVSLGGNGQFTRLTALLELGPEPWSTSLTEDLDLSVSLSVRGWHTTSTPRAAVDQQGVANLRALIRQRTRWYQGHMMAAARVPEVLRSNKMSTRSAIEMVLYLCVPWIFDLPWSVLSHLVILQTVLLVADGGFFTGGGGWLLVLQIFAWYLLSFWPALLTAVLSKRRVPSHTWGHALLMGHFVVVSNYLSFTCAWRALYRILTGKHGWAKTARLAEGQTLPAPVIAAGGGSAARLPAVRRPQPPVVVWRRWRGLVGAGPAPEWRPEPSLTVQLRTDRPLHWRDLVELPRRLLDPARAPPGRHGVIPQGRVRRDAGVTLRAPRTSSEEAAMPAPRCRRPGRHRGQEASGQREPVPARTRERW
ncbi:glycosyltransferase [Nocardioides sp. TF02-7]|uniref:glycosyltransferase n=1 Tax=Nocardioides sp. TF02-7 TaxID=2917724 RepID=UPI001F065939|nr:glycosyltransferase [Nocardioides sp. TF02-7]UMG94454.1 glycosyltransferase [Nocardioides sp. TF02-7]